MRKPFLVVLGLLLVAGAIGTTVYHYYWLKPQREAQLAARKAPEAFARRGTGQAERPGSTPSPAKPEMSGFHAFEIVLNVVNTLVGLVGIYLAVAGMRARPAKQ